ncbi:MAG: 3-methyl-2-oxobutanoate hydroxymethyltransferase [Rudaea sp.]|uniref:3-methyl-2-oxobutanoate hydroxymethyltransferase n=1 Tax=Rudaea sp. TaxID=2136325 RepID=UPI0039E630EC
MPAYLKSAAKPPVTAPRLVEMKAAGEKIVVLTAYDAGFAAQCEAAGVDVVLVGDSLGNVVQGRESTLPVTLDDMVYHTAAVKRGLATPLLIADLPFMTYLDVDTALRSSARLVAEGGAAMVKLEGADYVLDAIHALDRRQVPVCAHLGLTPQSVHKFGGYRVQGKTRSAAERLLADAHAVEDAGASLLVLECVPAALAKAITAALRIPTIGIGAGVACDGQVLVLYDMLGITPGKRPKFSKNFLAGRGSVAAAIAAYAADVRNGAFPGPEHSF